MHFSTLQRNTALLLSFSFIYSTSAQTGEWTWLKGPSSAGSPGVFGTVGVPAAGNNPPAVYAPFNWKTPDGRLWLFGGIDAGAQEQGALWVYDPATNMWTWMKGPNTGDFLGNYGQLGVESSSNLPPAKSYAACNWVDAQGDLWMFGGANTVPGAGNAGPFNDLWKYNVATNNWTWMHGPQGTNQQGVFGTLGVADLGNVPPPRSKTKACWVDDNEGLWMFGGRTSSFRDDLWRFDIPTNTWTWMNGSTITGASPSYGTLGSSSPSNTPGARSCEAAWKDPEGNFWLYGGHKVQQSSYSDLWKLDPTTAEWTWMGGEPEIDNPALYGTTCVESPTTTPGERANMQAVNTPDGKAYLFSGGLGTNFDITFTDLWSWCPTTNQMTWVKGPSGSGNPGFWGVQGGSDDLNYPNGRLTPAFWSSPEGQLYMFGGATTSNFNPHSDLWRFVPDPNCGECTITIGLEDIGIGQRTPTIIPNPAASGFSKVHFDANDWSYWLFDPSSRLVANAVVHTSEALLPPLEAGSYVLMIMSEDGTRFTSRLMVQ